MATDKNFVIKNGLTINGSEIITSAGNLTNVGTINSGAISTTGNLDVDGIIDNTRNNGNVSAPSTSDHTAGTRIKLYDANATSFYALGVESNYMWFNSDQGYKWYEDAAERMTLSSGGNLSIDGSLTATGINNASAELIDLNNATYLILKDPQGSVGIYIGGTGDVNNYYDSNAHIFRAKTGGSNRAVISGSGVDVKAGGLLINGTTVIDSSRNLTNIGTISSGAISANSGATNVVATFTSTDATSAIALTDSGGTVELSATGTTFGIQPNGGAAVVTVDGNGSATFSGTITASTGAYVNSVLALSTTGFNTSTSGTRKLGTFTTGQAGHTLHLKYIGGQGYNASNSQNGIVHIFFRTSNNSSSQTSSDGSSSAFYGSGHWWAEGVGVLVSDVHVKQVSSSVYEFYISGAAYAGNGHIIATNDHSSRWTTSMTTATLSGTYLTLPETHVFKTATSHDGGISVTGNITVTGTVDGVDIAARDAVLTSTTTTANAALPLSGGTMTGAINAGGGINGLTLSNGISGNNYNITGVNQININDPGEGIVFGTNCNLYLLDDANDNILRLDAPGGFRLHDGPLSMGTTTVIDTSRNLTNIGTISSGNITVANNSADPTLTFTTTSTTADPVIQMNGQAGITAEGFEIWYDNTVGDVHLHTTYNNDAAAIRFHTKTGASKSTSNERFTINGNGNINIVSGALQVGATTVIDSSRNLTNIGTISSGAITGSSYINGAYFQVSGSTVIDSSRNLTNINAGNITSLRVRGDLDTGYSTPGSMTGGISLWSTGATTSQIMFKPTSSGSLGNHGFCTDSYNTYFVMDTTNRGWVFRNATTATNIASIANTGSAEFNGTVRALEYHGRTNNAVVIKGYNGTALITGVNGAAYYYGSDSGDYGIVIQGAVPICKSVAIGSVNAGTTVIDSSRNLVNIGTISSGAITSSGQVSGTTLKVDATYDGFFGTASFSWGGSTQYPTLYSSYADRWVMVCFPHIPYLQNGSRGYTGTTYGSTVRFEGDASSSTYWDIGVGATNDVFRIGRAGSNVLTINSSFDAVFEGALVCGNYATQSMQSGTLNIGRTDTNYRWEGTTWSTDVKLGILANCSDYWEFGIHDSGESVESFVYYRTDTNSFDMGRDLGWGTTPIRAINSVQSPIFYDYNDTNYYCDPASRSVQKSLRLEGGATGNTQGAALEISNNGIWDGSFILTNTGTSGKQIAQFSTNSSFSQGGGRWLLYDFSAGDNIMSADTSSLIVKGNVTAYGSVSDVRFKENIHTIDNALDKIMNLRGVTFDWKEESDARKITKIKEDIGFIAQEVKEVLPELVRQEDDGYFGIRDKSIIAILVEAMKEQQEQIELLKQEIASLKGEK